MKTLLFTFPSRGGSTSVWNYLKQHPEIHPCKKKFMNTSEGGWLYWSHEDSLDEHWKKHTPEDYYKNFIFIDSYDSGVWIDGTDDVLDKKYLSLLKLKLKKFDRFCAIYTLRNPFKWYLSFYVFFKIGCFSLFTQGQYDKYIKDFIIPTYNLDNVKNNLDYFKSEFINYVPKISSNLYHLYRKFSKEDIWIDYIENVFKKQSEILNWLKIDTSIELGSLPHINTTTDVMYEIFGTYDVYNFWKELIFTDEDIYNHIITDCQEVEQKFEIDLIDYYNLYTRELSYEKV